MQSASSTGDGILTGAAQHLRYHSGPKTAYYGGKLTLKDNVALRIDQRNALTKLSDLGIKELMEQPPAGITTGELIEPSESFLRAVIQARELNITKDNYHL